jgi:hypothetical protein
VLRREERPGLAHLVVTRLGLPRSHPDWLAVAAGLLAVGTGDGRRADELPVVSSRLRFEQPLIEPDALYLDMWVPSAAAEAVARARADDFEALRSGRLPRQALERAKRYIESAFLPPAEAGHAAQAHALLEALGLPGEDPSERRLKLQELDRAAVLRAVAAHLR